VVFLFAVLQLSHFELLAVHLAEEVKGPHHAIEVGVRAFVVYAVQEGPVASLEQGSFTIGVVVGHQFKSERRSLGLGLVPLALGALSQIDTSFVVSIRPLLVNLEAEGLVGELRTFENVAELGRANDTRTLVLLRELIIPVVRVLHVELEGILALEMLLANAALLILLDLPLLDKLRHEMISELGERALVSVLHPLQSVGLEQGLHFRVNTVDHVLGVHP